MFNWVILRRVGLDEFPDHCVTISQKWKWVNRCLETEPPLRRALRKRKGNKFVKMIDAQVWDITDEIGA